MTDWRTLERSRPGKHPVRWSCHHMAGDRGKTYNGVGLRRNAGAFQPGQLPTPFMTRHQTKLWRAYPVRRRIP